MREQLEDKGMSKDEAALAELEQVLARLEGKGPSANKCHVSPALVAPGCVAPSPSIQRIRVVGVPCQERRWLAET